MREDGLCKSLCKEGEEGGRGGELLRCASAVVGIGSQKAEQVISQQSVSLANNEYYESINELN